MALESVQFGSVRVGKRSAWQRAGVLALALFVGSWSGTALPDGMRTPDRSAASAGTLRAIGAYLDHGRKASTVTVLQDGTVLLFGTQTYRFPHADPANSTFKRPPPRQEQPPCGRKPRTDALHG